MPEFEELYNDFVDANNPNNTEDLSSTSVLKRLVPGASLENAMQLFTMMSNSSNELNLTSSHIFQTSINIGGMYVCEASNLTASARKTINITVIG